METLAAQYSQWFGRSRGEEVKPGEGTEKIPREERGGGQSECCNTAQLRRGSCTWKMENSSSELLVATEETDTSSCPSSLAGKQQFTPLFLSYLLVCRRLANVTCVIKWLCCISCSVTWPLGDEELLLLSVNTAEPSGCRAGTCSWLHTAWSCWSCHTRGTVCVCRAQLQPGTSNKVKPQAAPPRELDSVVTLLSSQPRARAQRWFCSCGHTWLGTVNPQSTWQMGRTGRYFLPCSECQKTKSKVILNGV